MLKIFNDLKPFFEDNYRRISIREYARLKRITPPTAKNLLNSYFKEGILKKQREKRYIFYYANRDNKVFVDLCRIYWSAVLERSGFIKHINKNLFEPVIIVFGSFASAEISEQSDIDIAIFSETKKELKLDEFEKKLKRKLQIFVFKNIDDVKNKELLYSILNGYLISGRW